MPFLLKIRENKKKLLTAAIITGEAVNIIMTGEIPTNIPASIEILTTGSSNPKNQSSPIVEEPIPLDASPIVEKQKSKPIEIPIEYKNVEKPTLQRNNISYIQLIDGSPLPKQISVKTILDYTMFNNCILPVEFDSAKDLTILISLAEKPLKFTLQKHL